MRPPRLRAPNGPCYQDRPHFSTRPGLTPAPVKDGYAPPNRSTPMQQACHRPQEDMMRPLVPLRVSRPNGDFDRNPVRPNMKPRPKGREIILHSTFR